MPVRESRIEISKQKENHRNQSAEINLVVKRISIIVKTMDLDKNTYRKIAN